MTLFCKEERKVSLKYYSGFQEIRYVKSLENDTMTLSSEKKYTCYVLQDVMTDLGLLQNNNVRNHPWAAIWFSPFYFRDIPSVELEGKLYFCQRKEKIIVERIKKGQLL